MAHETPAWFSSLEGLPPYHTIRIPDDKVDAWLRQIVELWDHPETKPVMQSIWHGLSSFQRRLTDELAKWDWRNESSHQLLELAVAHGSLQDGLTSFLPKQYQNLFPVDVLQFLFAHQLLAVGESWLHDHPEDQVTAPSVLDALPESMRLLSREDRSALPLKRAIVTWMAAPFVGEEIGRRSKGHVGFSAAALVFVHDLFGLKLADQFIPDREVENIVSSAIDTLRASSWRQAKDRTGQALKCTSGDEHAAILNEHLSGAAWETVTKKWGHLKGLDVLARALDGELNVAPRAIVDDIMGDLSHIFPSAAASFTETTPASGARHRRYVTEVPLPGESQSDPYTSNAEEEDQVASGDRLRVSITERPEDQIDLAGLKPLCERFLSEHPEHREGLDLYLYDGPLTQEQQAKKLRIRVQTLINRKNRAVKALRSWAMRS
jgi:hypothetical protein